VASFENGIPPAPDWWFLSDLVLESHGESEPALRPPARSRRQSLSHFDPDELADRPHRCPVCGSLIVTRACFVCRARSAEPVSRVGSPEPPGPLALAPAVARMARDVRETQWTDRRGRRHKPWTEEDYYMAFHGQPRAPLEFPTGKLEKSGLLVLTSVGTVRKIYGVGRRSRQKN